MNLEILRNTFDSADNFFIYLKPIFAGPLVWNSAALKSCIRMTFILRIIYLYNNGETQENTCSRVQQRKQKNDGNMYFYMLEILRRFVSFLLFFGRNNLVSGLVSKHIKLPQVIERLWT